LIYSQGPELKILLPQPPECWVYRPVPPHRQLSLIKKILEFLAVKETLEEKTHTHLRW
jgi:hypothetical protein